MFHSRFSQAFRLYRRPSIRSPGIYLKNNGFHSLVMIRTASSSTFTFSIASSSSSLLSSAKSKTITTTSGFRSCHSLSLADKYWENCLKCHYSFYNSGRGNINNDYTLQNRRYFKSTKKQFYIQRRQLHSTGVDDRMRFVQFVKNSNGASGSTRGLGLDLPSSNEIVDLCAGDPTIPSDMKTFLEGSRTHLVKASRILGSSKYRLKKEDVQLLAPITQPDKLICIGMNYRDHCAEQNAKVPLEPVIFSKFSSCIIGPYDNIPYPEETQELDWEVELAFVIGKEGKKISAKDAMSHVFGFTVAHDVSARDWQMKKNGRQWLLGKTMDGFCPLGPSIVMKEDIMNPENLRITCSVNGVVKQDSSTSNLVHGIENLVVFLSRFFTLKPGDVVITGTPPGVGVFKKPPEFLKKGDVVKCEIQEIGSISNKIV